MPWVRFSDGFDWKPVPAVTIAYRAGGAYQVTTACANAAVKAGKAVRLRKASRNSEPVEVVDDDDRSA